MLIEGSFQHVNLVLGEKSTRLGFRTNFETRLWLDGLRNAVETEKEIHRTVEGVLKYNVSTLYFYFSAQMDNQIEIFVNSLTSNLLMSMSAVQFSNETKKIANEVGFLCDAFYARKPFVLALFKFILVNLHKRVRLFLVDYWNKFYKGFQAGDIVLIASSLSAYETKLNTWKVFDLQFTWSDAINSTLIHRLFQNSVTPLANVLTELRTCTFTEDSKLFSTSCSQLESHIYFLWSNFSEVPRLAFAEQLLILISKLLSAFLVTSIFLLQTESFMSHIYIGILNSGFLKMIKSFEKKVHLSTNSQLSLIHIKQLIDEPYLLTLLIQIDRLAFKKLKALWREEVRNRFTSSAPFLDYDFPKSLNSLIVEFTVFLNLILLETNLADLLFEIYDAFLSVYYELYISFATKLNLNNYQRVTQKLLNDHKTLLNQLDSAKYKHAPKNAFKFNQLCLFDQTDQMDVCIMSITNMQVFHAELMQIKTIDRLLKAKFLYPSLLSSSIYTYLSKAIEASEYQTRVQLIFKMMPVIFYTCNFKSIIRTKLNKQNPNKNKSERNFTFNRKKDSKVKFDSRPTTFDDLYEVEGWTAMFKFDVKIDDLEIESHLKAEFAKQNRQKKHHFPQSFCIFQTRGNVCRS